MIDEWAGYKERCQHGVRWENRCGACNSIGAKEMIDVTQRIESIKKRWSEGYGMLVDPDLRALLDRDWRWLCRLALAQEKFIVEDALDFPSAETERELEAAKLAEAERDLSLAANTLVAFNRQNSVLRQHLADVQENESMRAALVNELQQRLTEAERDKMAAVCQAENLVLALAEARAAERAECVRLLRSRFCEREADYSHFWKMTADWLEGQPK